jgi:hypothetical protein
MLTNKVMMPVGALLMLATFGSFTLIANAGTPLAATCTGSVSNSTITWSSNVTGGTGATAYLWSGTGIAGATSTSASATYTPGTYTATLTATDASSTVATATCSATIASAPVATTTPPAPLPHFFKSPQLEINPGGRFLARGMIVTSVASTSFTGTIWGTTWTVNFNPKKGDEAVERYGKTLKQFNLSSVKVGDEVAISGKINPSATLTVDAKVLRDYSLSTAILKYREGKHDEHKDEKKGKSNDR